MQHLSQQSSGISDFYLKMGDSFTAIFHITFDRRSTICWCNHSLLRRVRRQAEVKTTRCYSRFSSSFSLYISQVKIWSTNESRIFSGSRHSSIKGKIKQSVLKCIEPSRALKIVICYLSYPLLLFTFLIHTILLLLFFALDFFR